MHICASMYDSLTLSAADGGRSLTIVAAASIGEPQTVD